LCDWSNRESEIGTNGPVVPENFQIESGLLKRIPVETIHRVVIETGSSRSVIVEPKPALETQA
jgi:hypothetical protein